MVRRYAALLATLALSVTASCGGGEGAPPTTPQGSTIAVQGGPGEGGSSVDGAALDRSTAACDDFYQHACGGWIKATEIPAHEATWTRSFSTIRDRNEELLREILEAKAKGESGGDAYEKELGDFYASCMDEEAIERAGTKVLDPWLKTIDEIKDPASLTTALGKLQADGLSVVWEMGAFQDFNDSTQVIGLFWQGGLGMPERDYYLDDKTPKMVELRGVYEKHVAAMMKLAGESDAAAKSSARTVLDVETAMARAWMTKEDRREPKKINHRATRAELGKVAPGITWDRWLQAAGAGDVQVINVAQPEFMKAVGQMIQGKVAIPAWKTYLRWQVYAAVANALPKRFVDESFAWRRALVGAQSLPPRWKRCVRAVDGAMGEALARPFVKKTLGDEGKAIVVSMVHGIEAAMHDNLQTIGWMDDSTRKAAFAKLSKIANKIAYPEKWRSYDGLTVKRDSYPHNILAGASFEHRRQMAKIGKPLDRGEWQMSPPSVNAYYDGQLNEMVFPAGILQPPFFSPSVSMPLNFGGVGMVMGHELTHGFDDQGRQFDAAGDLKDWWTEKVNAEFEGRASCVKKQFDDYTVLGDVHVNGQLTLGENIADLGGVKLAYHAMKKSPAAAGAVAGRAEQEFFYGFAQGWCSKYRDEALRHLVATNPHSPPSLRVNGPLSNLPEFAAAFGCKAGSPMVRANRCEVW